MSQRAPLLALSASLLVSAFASSQARATCVKMGQMCMDDITHDMCKCAAETQPQIEYGKRVAPSERLWLQSPGGNRTPAGDTAVKGPVPGNVQTNEKGDNPTNVEGGAAGLAGGIVLTKGMGAHAMTGPDGKLMTMSVSGDETPTPFSDVVADIMTTAKIKAAEQPMFSGLIMATANQVVSNMPKGVETLPRDNVGTFGRMLDLQLERQTAQWKLGRQERQGLIDPATAKEQRARIESDYTTKMGKMTLGEEVMDPFHAAFDTNFETWKKDRQDSGEWQRGLPNRGHIDGMLNNNPNNASNWSISAADKLSTGDKAGAREALDKSISLGGTADAFAMRSELKKQSRDFDGAYADAKKALALKPGDPVLIGLLKTIEGRVSPQALASGGASSGSASPSGGAGGAKNASLSGFATGGFGAPAVRDIPGMTTAATLSSSQKLDEARRALSLGDSQSAIELARRALEMNPNNAAAYGLLSGIYSRTGDYRKAIEAASAGLALAPRDSSLLNSKAYAENRSKQWRDALASSNGAIEADARNPYGYANRAHAYGGLGDKESMLSDINRAAALDPRFQKAAADAAALQLPSSSDVLFLFPGEDPKEGAPAAAPVAPRRGFGFVVGASVVGGLLLALGLLSTVLAPLKDSVVSAFTKATRRGPSLHELDAVTAEPVSAAGNAGGLIRGQYEISRQIGAGGMGMVYEGTDRSLGRRVAIKKMRDELRVNARERDRFVIEAKTVASLHHQNIVDIYAIAEEGDDVYLVFEYVDGKTIHDLVQANGRLQPSEAARLTSAIGDALSYAHAHGVIHRDMKPSNVMVTGDGRIKVMDFGIARMAKDAMTRYSMTNTVVGTPPYMAPEQEQGVVRKESDVYSLAICAYEMLTGKLPFIGVSAGMLMNKINMSFVPPSRAIAGLPEALDPVFEKAFQADPDRRHHTPQEFAAELERALGGGRPAPFKA